MYRGGCVVDFKKMRISGALALLCSSRKTARTVPFALLLCAALLPAQNPPKKSTTPVKKTVPPVAETAAAPPPVAATTPAEPFERLTYSAEWRMIHAGTVTFESAKNRGTLKLESAGLVSALFKIRDTYTIGYEDGCAAASVLDSLEGKRHHETKVTYDRAGKRASFLELDLLKNATIRTTSVEIPGCVQDVLGGLMTLRGAPPALGQSLQVPTSDGRKFAYVKVDAQERETVKGPLGSMATNRYEAFLLNGVVYPRKGRLLIWLTEDSRHLPVQIRLKLPFPVGTVTLQLQKEERN